MASSVIANGIKVSNGLNTEGTSDTTKDVGSAVWWNPLIMNSGGGESAEQNVAGDPSSRTPSVTSLLEGEIHLDSDLFPTCDVPFLSVSYTVSASITSATQDLTVERVRPAPAPSTSPPVSPRSSRRFSQRLSQILSPSSVKNAILGAANDALKDLENVASTAVEIVTVKGEGDPIPVSFMPRSAPKKVDLSIVKEVEYSGVVVAGFV
ncbi:hypothetical protein EST38_g6482 [Candolleomyces aberdarensis]|uniref:Uncharacterized protein n=1 Tax=Candolleomyces aberdarensis TaxID=2316362 RepID=A0A4Q2DHS3_9AGAR|nr:hypothetical protein EST38_g6482 [Candolleomyces aberdarensis]